MPSLRDAAVAAFSTLALLSGACEAGAVAYDAAAAFDHLSNPNGVWSYGGYAVAGDPGTFFLFDTSVEHFLGFHGTHGYEGGAFFVILQPHATPDFLDAEVLQLHPSGSGQEAVLRWTAPGAGEVTVSAEFAGFDRHGAQASTDVAIVVNEIVKASGHVSGFGHVLTLSVTAGLEAGGVIDFVVGFGEDGNNHYDSTSLDATLAMAPTRAAPAAAPVPAAAPLLAAGLAGLVLVGRRRSGSRASG